MNGDFISLLKSLFIPVWGLFCIALVWIIRTRAANKTADNDAQRVEIEAAVSADAITGAQLLRLQNENTRLGARVEQLEGARDRLEQELEQSHHERDELRRENLELKAGRLIQEQVRQRAAEVVAGDRHAEQEEQKK